MRPKRSETRPLWYDEGRRHLWHPYTQMATAPPPIPIVRADGAYLYTADGREILDGISSWWVTLHGHSHRRIAEAIARQAATLDHVIFAGFSHEPAARLAAKLVDLVPSGLDKVFYSDNGSTAVEVALKMAFQYWINVSGKTRQRFIAIEGAYHGDTLGTMAVGDTDTFHGLFEPLLFKVLHARNPYLCQRPSETSFESLATDCSRDVERHLEAHQNEVAAVIIEPMVQGAGGMIIWPAQFLKELRQICDRYETLLIADEVFTGFGRTGKLFACEHGPVTPDILCLSKAITGGTLPLAATLCKEKIYNSFLSEDRRKTFFHGHSYTANPIACAAALESLAILQEDGLSRIEEIQEVHRARLEGLRSRPSVADTRVLGLIARIELRGSSESGKETGYLDDIGPLLYRQFLKRNILLRPLGNILYLLPPLAMSDHDLGRIYDAIEEVLSTL